MVSDWRQHNCPSNQERDRRSGKDNETKQSMLHTVGRAWRVSTFCEHSLHLKSHLMICHKQLPCGAFKYLRVETLDLNWNLLVYPIESKLL